MSLFLPESERPVAIMESCYTRTSSLDFGSLFQNELFADLKIFVKESEGPDSKFISVHKALLAAGSSYFSEMLTADPKMEAVNLNERYDIVVAGLSTVLSLLCGLPVG